MDDDGAHCRLCFIAWIFPIIAFGLCKNAEQDMNRYSDYDALKKEFVEQVGYAGKLEIPVQLVRKVAEFIDAYPDDGMTSYYARSLLKQFYRKRTKNRSIRLFNLLGSFLKQKSLLIDLFLWPAGREPRIVRLEEFDIATIWSAISDLEDGYAKANYIGHYSHLFNDEVAGLAYQSILAMPDPYKTRSLAGLYPKLDKLRKTETLAYLLQQFADGSAEAAYQLKLIFPYLDNMSRTEVVAAHLELQDVPESLIAYFMIRNVAYFEHDDASRLAARARTFKSDYLRNRCLLKLAAYLREGEVETLYEQFMKNFNAQPASSALIHNLYHFGSVLKTLDATTVVSLALEKIDCLVISPDDYFKQAKYCELKFVMPLMNETHRDRAFCIAETVRGRYKKALMSKLKAHFANSKGFCEIRASPICY